MPQRVLQHACGGRQPHCGRRLRQRNQSSADARQRDRPAPRRGRAMRRTGRRVGPLYPLGFEMGRFGRRTEQRLDAMAELARERERRTDAGLVNARLDRAQRLARETGAPRQFVLSQATRKPCATHRLASAVRNTTCHTACIMA
jgi:hypothetical protein